MPFKLLGKKINIKYLLCKPDEIKICYFEGLCINSLKKQISLFNKIKREKIYIKFHINNPIIIKIKTKKKTKKQIKKINFL